MNDPEKPIPPSRESIPDEGAPPTENRGRVRSLESTQRYGGGRSNQQVDDEIERELQEAMGGLSADQLLAEPERKGKQPAAPPGPRKGRVIQIHDQDIFVEVTGGRSQGLLTMDQFPEGPPKVGDEVEFMIEGARDGNLLLTRRGAAVHVDWSSVQEGLTVEARVTGTNKGGLSVEVNGIRGFMPISHIDLFRVENAEQYVNQRLLCIVTDVDPIEKNLVVSRRALLEKEREEQKEKTWGELAEGQVRQGVVRSIRENLGAFVDLGGVDGLLHVSEMSWQRVSNIESVVQLGQTIKVVVLKLDREKKKISLGLRQLTASPWDNILDRYASGSVVKGKVTRLAEFGAFVELEPAIEGLIHISELDSKRVFRAKDVVQVGHEVTVLVLSIDPAQRRISLSLKQAAKKEPEPTEEETDEEYVPPPPRERNPNLRGGLGERK